jgi:hypothetical protein
MRQQGKTISQRNKERRQSLPPEELQRSDAIRNKRYRIPLSQIQSGTSSSSSSAALGSLSSSSTAIQNINNLLNDEDEDNSFSEDSLERSFTRSPVKNKPPKTKNQPP